MSVLVMPQHNAAYFTCDYLGGKPEHRSTCRADATIKTDPDAPSRVPEGWLRLGRAHLCDEHRGETSVCSLVWPLVVTTPPGEPS